MVLSCCLRNNCNKKDYSWNNDIERGNYRDVKMFFPKKMENIQNISK